MMGNRRPLVSGDLLAGRYELRDLVIEQLGSSIWRAHDNLLQRNVGLEILPSSDARAEAFLDAARLSTRVNDPRFLRVLDLIESERSHHLIVREWARGFGLDQVLQQSPLPNRRSATVVAEVAEALAHAHEFGLYHLRLTPRHVLLKQSGAVRIAGLGVATALSPRDHAATAADRRDDEAQDVEALGSLLYSCLTSHWPKVSVDGLPVAPTAHGELLRPRQVRAGVARDVDSVCDRILGDPPRSGRSRLTTAIDIARTVRMSGEDDEPGDDQPSLVGLSSPDLLRLDPVIVPTGPPPGLEPPRRRPKAYDPSPPTPLERAVEVSRSATRGSRGMVMVGVLATLALAAVLSFLVGVALTDREETPPDTSAPIRALPIRSVGDYDPLGVDGENSELARFAIDEDLKTAWSTDTYFGNSRLGGLKEGVGLMLDLGVRRQVTDLRIYLGGDNTDLSILVAPARATVQPRAFSDLDRVASVDDVGSDTTVLLPVGTRTRFVVVWLRSIPQTRPGEFVGSIREIRLRGRA